MNRKSATSFLAIDLGATSGRAILGSLQEGRLKLNEVHRFPNKMLEVNGRLYWNLLYLYHEILQSLKMVHDQQLAVVSIGIDTWGVDFVCFGKDGEPLRMPYSYRDASTFGAPERFFKKIPKDEVYRRTGIQIMPFNSLFQLDNQLEKSSSIIPITDKILFMPDALSYLLTGQMVTEYTIASTSQMLNALTRNFDPFLLEAIHLNEEHFAPMVFSGTTIGTLSESVKRETGLGDLAVVAVAGHDTASAVLATPAENNHFAYLSSGTWSLIGIESNEPVINETTYALNYTNEGGADGSIRLLKNICGMWILERCKKEWDRDGSITYEEIIRAAEEAVPFRSYINPDDRCFSAPDSMIQAIQTYCRKSDQQIPETVGEISRCIYESLAFRYKQELGHLQQLATFPIQVLHIIGGGSKNGLLNRYTANACGIPVIAGPSEATALGNILLQAKALGLVETKEEIRAIVRRSIHTTTFEPQDETTWNNHYADFLKKVFF